MIPASLKFFSNKSKPQHPAPKRVSRIGRQGPPSTRWLLA